MIFARYRGIDKMFTAGRIYVAKPEMDDKELFDSGFIEVVDDGGCPTRVYLENDQFEFVEEVYAVARVSLEDIARGEVVVVDDASEDRSQLSVKGSGFWQADKLVILDRTNVFPGMAVCDRGKWVKISRVDEALWIIPETWDDLVGKEKFRSPEEFQFALSEAEGEIMVEPLVTCVRADHTELTVGRKYYLLESRADCVVVRSDVGQEVEYFADRFRMG